jgi:ribosome-associated protein
MIIVNDRLSVPLHELNFDFARSSGPGGQNVNKVNSKVILHWDVTRSPSIPDDVRQRFLERYRQRVNKAGELVIHSQRFRDQGRNVADCIDKLRDLLLSVATVPKARKRTRPTRSAVEQRLQQKKRRSQTKQQRGGGNDW